MAGLPKQYTTVWHVLFAALLCAVVLILCAGKAEAEGQTFRDDFDIFNGGKWIKSDYALGRDRFDPRNVSVGNGKLRLKVPAGTLNGAEIESRETYGYGTFVARMKTPMAPSSITGFYLYRSPDFQAEIDIEAYNDGTGAVDYVTYADGEKTHLESKKLPFDPRKGFHTYRIDYYPNVVRFYVDGSLVQRYKTGLPEGSMKLLVNTWFPEWLPGIVPLSDRYTVVDWIRYTRP